MHQFSQIYDMVMALVYCQKSRCIYEAKVEVDDWIEDD